MRLVNIAARQQGAVCQQVLQQYGDELTRGAIITVEAGRVRIRPPDSSGP
jgi:predicted nuclease of predicted toxin-antitoxin system